MNLFNKEKKLEKKLETFNLPIVKKEQVDNAEIRVWNRVSHSLLELDDNSRQMNKQVHAENKKQIWYRYQKQLGVASLLLIMLFVPILASGYVRYRNSNINNGTQNSDIGTDIQSRAAARFKELNGVAYEQSKSLKAESTRTAQTFGANDSTALRIDRDSALTLAEEIKKGDEKIYYTRQEFTYYGNAELLNTFYSPISSTQSGDIAKLYKVDSSKPFTFETWYSPRYATSRFGQGSTVISYYAHSPTNTVMYLGGKYAIKTNFTESFDLNAFVAGDGENPEINFLRSLLDNKDFYEQLGREKVDGKDVLVFQTRNMFRNEGATFDPKTSTSDRKLIGNTNHKTKYFVDAVTFSLYITENYSNDKLIHKIKNLETRSMTVADYQDDKTKDLSGIQIKELDMNSTAMNMEGKFVDAIKKQTIYYIANSASTPQNLQYPGGSEEREKYELLLNTTDFNPGYVPQPKQISTQFASYSQQGYFFSVVTQDPAQASENQLFEVKTSDKKITIDGRVVTAKLLVLDFNKQKQEDSPADIERIKKGEMTVPAIAPAQSSMIVFKGNGNVWHQIMMNTGFDKAAPIETVSIDLKTISSSDAARFDRINENRKNAYPQMKNVSLDSIDKAIRLLPGDLMKDFNVQASMVSVSAKNNNQSSMCDQFEETFSVHCVIEKLRGFQLSFTEKYENLDSRLQAPDQRPGEGSGSSGSSGMTSPAYGGTSLEYIVLNANQNESKVLLERMRVILDKTGYETRKMVTKEVSGKTIVIITSLDSKKVDSIFRNIGIDNGLDILQQQIESSGRGHLKIMETR